MTEFEKRLQDKICAICSIASDGVFCQECTDNKHDIDEQFMNLIKQEMKNFADDIKLLVKFSTNSNSYFDIDGIDQLLKDRGIE